MDNVRNRARELIPYLNTPAFKEVFAEIVSEAGGNADFLLKMELRRLCAPCLRVMDFRNDGDCEIFTFSGTSHFLQKEDIEEFRSLAACYGGVYTKGVYEEVMRSHNERKKIRRQESGLNHDPNSPARFNLDEIRFASYAHRRDERMYYSSAIVVAFPDGRLVNAKTSDLSCSGIKVLLPCDYEFTQREKIRITFTKLIELYPGAARILTGVPYETLGVEKRDVRCWLKTRCLSDNKDLERFILGFQNANKYRYRIDIDYMAYILNIKAIEYQYLPKIIGIPLFFAGREELRLAYALKSDHNHEQLDYWRDEKADDKMGTLFTRERMAKLLKKPEGRQYTYIYAFKHTMDGHVFFLSATMDELQESGLTDTFFAVSKNRATFRVFRFEISAVKLDDKTLHGLAGACGDEKEAQTLYNNLAELTYIGLLTRINTPGDAAVYDSFTSSQSVNRLQIFTHDTDNIQPVKLEYLQYITPRKEQRYLYRTEILAAGDSFPEIAGWTRDISNHGLQVEFSSPVKCFNGDVVYISMPQFQKLKKTVSLMHVPYEVVFINSAHTIMHLQLHGLHSAVVLFFDELINANQHVLEPAKNLSQMSETSKALRSITVSHLFSTPIIFMRSKASRLGYVCDSANSSRARRLFHIQETEPKQANVYPLFSNQVLRGHILSDIEKIKAHEIQKQYTIYVRREVWEDKITYVPQVEDSFMSPDDQRSFIERGLAQGYFGAYAVYVTANGRPEVSEIKQELDYIRRYAPHKFKTLDSNIWNIMGIGDVIDITESVMVKLGLPVVLGEIPEIPDAGISLARQNT